MNFTSIIFTNGFQVIATNPIIKNQNIPKGYYTTNTNFTYTFLIYPNAGGRAAGAVVSVKPFEKLTEDNNIFMSADIPGLSKPPTPSVSPATTAPAPPLPAPPPVSSGGQYKTKDGTVVTLPAGQAIPSGWTPYSTSKQEYVFTNGSATVFVSVGGGEIIPMGYYPSSPGTFRIKDWSRGLDSFTIYDLKYGDGQTVQEYNATLISYSAPAGPPPVTPPDATVFTPDQTAAANLKTLSFGMAANPNGYKTYHVVLGTTQVFEDAAKEALDITYGGMLTLLNGTLSMGSAWKPLREFFVSIPNDNIDNRIKEIAGTTDVTYDVGTFVNAGIALFSNDYLVFDGPPDDSDNVWIIYQQTLSDGSIFYLSAPSDRLIPMSFTKVSIDYNNAKVDSQNRNINYTLTGLPVKSGTSGSTGTPNSPSTTNSDNPAGSSSGSNILDQVLPIVEKIIVFGGIGVITYTGYLYITSPYAFTSYVHKLQSIMNFTKDSVIFLLSMVVLVSLSFVLVEFWSAYNQAGTIAGALALLTEEVLRFVLNIVVEVGETVIKDGWEVVQAFLNNFKLIGGTSSGASVT